MSSRPLAQVLAEFILQLRYESLEKKVVDKAKMCLLDLIGVALAGAYSALGKKIVNFVKNINGVKESTIIGDGTLVSAIHATFANATLAHIHELDDGHRYAMGHPGAVVIPAALALAEKVGATGKELLTAIVAGYEAFIRLGMAINPSHFKRGFHTTATVGTFAAAAAAGKILGLNKSELVHALGLAGVQSAGLLEVTRGKSFAKPIQVGRAAQSGVLAALLAREGVTAPDTIFEGEYGFFHAFVDKYDPEVIVRDLGNTYTILGVYHKFHASCRHTHPAIDAALKLVKEYDLKPEEIAEVQVYTYSAAYNLCGKEYEPQSASTAKFSIPYCVAVAIYDREASINSFTEDKIRNPAILNLARRVKVVPDPELDSLVPRERGARVRIVLTNNKVHEAYVRNPYGEPEWPATFGDIKAKFRSLSSLVLTPQSIDETINMVEELEDIHDIRALTRKLYKPGP